MREESSVSFSCHFLPSTATTTSFIFLRFYNNCSCFPQTASELIEAGSETKLDKKRPDNL